MAPFRHRHVVGGLDQRVAGALVPCADQQHTPQRGHRDRLAIRRLDLALLVTGAALLLTTLALLLDQSLSFTLIDRSAEQQVLDQKAADADDASGRELRPGLR